MSDTSEPAHLRNLRRLVSLLMVVMIFGLLTIVAIFVMRFAAIPSQVTSLELPDGITAQAYTRGPDWVAIVSDDDTILIYNLDGTLRQTVQITRP